MAKLKQFSKQEAAGIISVALLFLVASFASEKLANVLDVYLGAKGIGGMAIYTLIVTGIVLIPFASSLPLVPLAVALWGSVTVAILTLIAWTTSATISFSLARKLGVPVFKKLRAFTAIQGTATMLPQKNAWWGLLGLAAIGVPVEILSYATGLFTNIPYKKFIVPVFLGTIPLAFFIAYTASLPPIYQTYIIGTMLLMWLGTYLYLRNR